MAGPLKRPAEGAVSPLVEMGAPETVRSVRCRFGIIIPVVHHTELGDDATSSPSRASFARDGVECPMPIRHHILTLHRAWRQLPPNLASGLCYFIVRKREAKRRHMRNSRAHEVRGQISLFRSRAWIAMHRSLRRCSVHKKNATRKRWFVCSLRVRNAWRELPDRRVCRYNIIQPAHA